MLFSAEAQLMAALREKGVTDVKYHVPGETKPRENMPKKLTSNTVVEITHEMLRAGPDLFPLKIYSWD